MAGATEELSHNLAREWVTERLAAARVERAAVQSEWVRKGVAWPQTSGEHEDPTGIAEPDIVSVYVTIPAGVEATAIEAMVGSLREETEAEPRLGGRVEAGSMHDWPSQVERVDHLDLGPEAQRISLSFTIAGPVAPIA